MAFNNPMLLPDNFLDLVKESRLRQLNGDGKAMIEILSVAGEDSSADMLGLDWEILSFSPLGLDFKLFYTDPLEISQNAEPDIAKVVLNLSQFTDEYGQAMADGTILEVEIPRQIPSQEEADALEESGETAEGTSSITMGSNFILNLILAASLNHLWSMINGIQLTTHMQIFNLKFPANASFLLRFLVDVATFDLIPISAIWYFFDLPETGSYSLNF